MAIESQIGGEGTLFVGEDKIIEFGPLADMDDSAVGIDMTGWTLIFDVRKNDNSADPAILSKSLTVSGVFNATQASNQQIASTPVSDDELNLFKAQDYRWSWKRMDPGNETVLGWGTFAPQKATAP